MKTPRRSSLLEIAVEFDEHLMAFLRGVVRNPERRLTTSGISAPGETTASPSVISKDSARSTSALATSSSTIAVPAMEVSGSRTSASFSNAARTS